jgi:hypothetical protein
MAFLLLTLSLTLLTAWLWLRRSSRQSNYNLPPGPPKLPLIGNILSIPSTNQWLAFSQWAKEYGKLTVDSQLKLTVSIWMFRVRHHSSHRARDIRRSTERLHRGRRSLGKTLVHLFESVSVLPAIQTFNLTLPARPKLIMATELMGWSNSLFFLPYGRYFAVSGLG